MLSFHGFRGKMMQYRKFAILVFSILFAAVAFWSYKVNEWGETMPLTAVVVSEGHTEELTCWKDQWNDYCFFLPSYADPSMVQIRSHSDDEIWIGDYMMTPDGLSCEQFRIDEVYGLARFGFGNSYDGVIRFVQSGNVPTLFIDVPSGSMEYIHQEKGNEETGTMRLYGVDGDLQFDGNLDSIKGRGNATWGWWKKSYSLTLSNETDLLGMGQAQRWILLANGYDRSNMKNKIAYDLAGAAGMAYSPECQWVDLYLNGEYTGVYLLCERNEVHPERVDITPENSFLVSREGEGRLIRQQYPYVGLKLGAFRIHHSTIEHNEVEEMWKSVESALLAEDGVDPRTGKHWTELIDLDSWVEKYLIDEIAANHDGGCISQYFYYDGEDATGKIYAGPVWDMDITFGADYWQIAPPNNFVARRPVYLEENYSDVIEYSPFYMLYQKEEFYQRMVEIYEQNFRPALAELLDSGLDRYAQEISQAANANLMRWQNGFSEEDIEHIRTFLTARVAFLDAIWIRGEEFCDVLMMKDNTISENHVAAWFAVRPGECLPEISTPENGAWYVYGTDELFDVTQPVYESVKVYLKEEPVPQEQPTEDGNELAAFAVLVTFLTAIVAADKIRTRKNRTGCNQDC